MIVNNNHKSGGGYLPCHCLSSSLTKTKQEAILFFSVFSEVNGTCYSPLSYPITMCEKHYSLVWYIPTTGNYIIVLLAFPSKSDFYVDLACEQALRGTAVREPASRLM